MKFETFPKGEMYRNLYVGEPRNWTEVRHRVMNVGATSIERELRYLLIEACNLIERMGGDPRARSQP